MHTHDIIGKYNIIAFIEIHIITGYWVLNYYAYEFLIGCSNFFSYQAILFGFSLGILKPVFNEFYFIAWVTIISIVVNNTITKLISNTIQIGMFLYVIQSLIINDMAI